MARGINQVDQVVVAVSRDILRDARQIFVGNFIKQRDAGRFDRDATILLVLTSIRQTRIAGVFLRDNTRRRDQGIRQSGFALFIERELGKRGEIASCAPFLVEREREGCLEKRINPFLGAAATSRNRRKSDK